MRKAVSVFVCLFVLLSGAFAWQNTYNSSTSEYKTLMRLCDISGLSSPIMVTPVSSDQMLSVLRSIDTDRLDESSKAVYDRLKSTLESPSRVLSYADDVRINAFSEISYQKVAQSECEYDFMIAKRDRKPMINLGSEIHFDRSIYAYFQFDLTNTGLGYDEAEHKFSRFADSFQLQYDAIDMSSPHKAFMSVGNEKANLIVGRDRMDLGNGKTGNLALGDTLWYQDFVKASVLNGPVSYDMTVLSFENSKGEPFDTDYHKSHPFDMSHDPTFTEPQQLVVLHNLSFRPVRNLTLSLYEGALSYGSSIMQDLRLLNPMFVLHNTFRYMKAGLDGGTNAGNMNNFFGFEVRGVLDRGWALDLQGMADQIQFSPEIDADATQAAFGLLANVTKSSSLAGGLSQFYLEGAYTSPNLYLKEDTVVCGQYWNLDLIVGKMIVWSPTDNDFSYLGYKYGPDTLAVATGFSWDDMKSLSFDVSGLFKLHGTQGALYYEGQNDSTIRMGEDLKTDILTGPFEKRMVLDLSLRYKVSEALSLEGELAYQKAWDYHNIIGKNYDDFQAAFAVTVDPMGFARSR